MATNVDSEERQGSPLFEPMTIRGVTIRNRIAVSPMWQYSGVEGMPTDTHLVNLGRFAMGGAGLVFQEGTSIIKDHRGTTGDLGIWNDEVIPHFRRITDFIRSTGATPGIQLMHPGRKGRARLPWHGRGPLELAPHESWNGWEVVGASAVPYSDGYPVPREISTAEIPEIIQAWANAAGRANESGYDVLDIHAAHGYLIHDFLSPLVNTRTDQYGGSFENRIRFLCEVVSAIRTQWPAEKPLFVRLSIEDGGRWGIEDSANLALHLKPLGVDVIDCSSGGMGKSGIGMLEPSDPGRFRMGYQVPLAKQVRQLGQIPTMAVGLIVSATQAEEVVSSGAADLVALGRELLLNPNWPLAARVELEGVPDFSLAPDGHAYYLAGRERSASRAVSEITTRRLEQM